MELRLYKVGDVRRSYNPWPDYLGVDTVISSDADKGPSRESDPRMDTIGPALDAYRTRRGAGLVPALRTAGVRWLVVPAVAQGDLFPGLAQQGGLEPVVVDPSVSLYRVTGGVTRTRRNGCGGASGSEPGRLQAMWSTVLWSMTQEMAGGPGFPVLRQGQVAVW